MRIDQTNMDKPEYEGRKAALINLFRENETPYSDGCIKALHNDKLREELGSPLPIKAVRQTYTQRGEYAKARDHPIYGYEGLLSHLAAAAQDSLVQIQAIEAGDFNYKVFTDEKVQTLFGILAIDETTDWRSRAEREELKWEDL